MKSATKSKPADPPIKSEDLRDERATIVNIAVRKLDNGKYELRVFPKRSGDTMIFHSERAADESPEKPRQVRWIVSGLGSGQTIRIEPKQANTGYLPLERYEIEYPHNSVRSGRARRHPAHPMDLVWSYNVFLFDDDGVLLDHVDPQIIIKDDP